MENIFMMKFLGFNCQLAALFVDLFVLLVQGLRK